MKPQAREKALMHPETEVPFAGAEVEDLHPVRPFIQFESRGTAAARSSQTWACNADAGAVLGCCGHRQRRTHSRYNGHLCDVVGQERCWGCLWGPAHESEGARRWEVEVAEKHDVHSGSAGGGLSQICSSSIFWSSRSWLWF